MKIYTILTALAVLAVALTHPAQAEFTRTKGEVTHLNGIPLPPIQTAAQARAETEKRLAAIKATEAKVAAQASVNPPSAISNPEFFYTGKPYLQETGQYVFLFRHYDPELGRWTSADPSGFPDWPNNYLYSNTPVSGVDSDGLAWNELNYIWHFVTGGGSAVSLVEMGLSSSVQDFARGGIIPDFGQRIANYAREMIKPYSGSFQLSLEQRFDDYSSVSYPLGRAGLSGYFQGTMTSTPSPGGIGGTYSYSGTATISFADIFSDPYNILEFLYGNSNTQDAPEWVRNAANAGWLPGAPVTYFQGTPFAITGSWVEPFTGGGVYE